MNEQQISLFGSKKSDDWSTPKEFYDKWNKEFNFDFDPCPLHSDFDGLKINWGKRNFVNPPYSKVKDFLKKSLEELEKGNAELCVFLVFTNTDTAWFHDYVYGKAELRFIRGRLKFGGGENSAMRPSMLCIFRRNNEA